MPQKNYPNNLGERMPYNHFEHRHRFAIWAAARASQRAFTTIENLRNALESTDVQAFILNPESLHTNAQSYDVHHRIWCNKIVEYLSDIGVKKSTFGRAAKLISVYIKAMIVVGEGAESSLATVAHPPIDRVLLQNLASSRELESQYKEIWRSTAWTKLDENGYYQLLGTLRSVIPENRPWWELEQYWTVTNG